ncbi:MAG: filamentous hemagglutinin N-terminal domain-containing protein [Pleurocapsa sp. MO_226.B13]|nr:filamentous hemagglutinin N-terminal domain-containing protein [Pleurocapsa sp. MO_226.B13]
MYKSFSPLFQFFLSFSSCLFATATLAQITPDNTLDTQVNSQGNVAEITGGQTRGDNLFHSFQDFSVATGSEAFFNNADNISNIFSRVTGGNVSQIDGLIRANGSADLFLINPNGIIFGENASLNIGGSFLASTAESILFEEGEFSATDLDPPPLLTINQPIGLGLPDNPAAIVNRSVAPRLEVEPGNNLSLVGGNIRFEGGKVSAPGSSVELGGLSTIGTIGISEDGSLTFPEDVAKADVILSDGAEVDVMGTGGGKIVVNAGNLSLTGNSFLDAGITGDSTSEDAQAGDITIKVAENLTLNDSRIRNLVNEGGMGNSGKIDITTGSLEATNGGRIDASTSGQGNAGSVEITATGEIIFDGATSEGDPSSATNRVNSDGEGNTGGVTIDTTNLTLTNGGRIDASTSGQGDAGSVEITATGEIIFDGVTSEGDPSSATSRVNSDGEGNAGGVIISTSNLTLTNGGRIDASTSGQGNAGSVEITATGEIIFDGATLEGDRSEVTSQVDSDGEGNAGGVTIETTNLTLTNGGRIDASTSGQGDTGSVEITATGEIIFDDATSEGDRSEVTSRVNSEGVGDTGGVTIETTNLTLTNGARINASTAGQGDASLVEITATGEIIFDGATSEGDRSEVTSRVDSDGEGNAGGVIISTTNLNLTNGGRIDTSTSGQGDAGFVDLTARGDMTFNGTTLEGDRSGVTSRVNQNGEGDVGDINISTTNLNLANGGRIDVASTRGTGDGGDINITAREDITLRNNSLISAQSSGNNDGGNINIDARFIIAESDSNQNSLVDVEPGQEANFAVDLESQFGNDILASAEQGQGGNITINARSLFGIEERPLSDLTNDINASSEFGLSGTVEIDILEADPSQDSLNVPVQPVQAEVAQTCEANIKSNQSEFVVTGRGGLPPEPEDNFRLSTTATGDNTLTSATSTPQQPEVTPPVIEATGWVRNAQGKIVLVAPAAQKSFLNSQSNPSSCNSEDVSSSSQPI